MLYFGAKDQRGILTNAKDTDEAYKQIALALGITGEPENIDLDLFLEFPKTPKAGKSVEIKMETD